MIFFLQRQSEDYDYGEQDETEAALGLPSDSRTIRDNIVDEFTCDGRPYGYYADVANECQIFHICYPVTYADGEEEMFKWSFICPNGTIFDQVSLIKNNTWSLSGFTAKYLLLNGLFRGL